MCLNTGEGIFLQQGQNACPTNYRERFRKIRPTCFVQENTLGYMFCERVHQFFLGQSFHAVERLFLSFLWAEENGTQQGCMGILESSPANNAK